MTYSYIWSFLTSSLLCVELYDALLHRYHLLTLPIAAVFIQSSPEIYPSMLERASKIAASRLIQLSVQIPTQFSRKANTIATQHTKFKLNTGAEIRTQPSLLYPLQSTGPPLIFNHSGHRFRNMARCRRPRGRRHRSLKSRLSTH